MGTVPALGLALMAAVASGGGNGGDKPPFTATTKRHDDRVSAKREKTVTVVDVESPFGISHAVVERAGEAWPGKMTLRLHLTGLESLTATCGTATLHGSVTGGGDPRPITITVEGREDLPQGPGDPHFLDFRAVGKDGKRSEDVPLKGGYFELRLPKAFFEGNPKSFKVEWVDWFRR